ncbi:MAG: DMT family transporter [Candidatus Curtissbacteria bacterium]|nr:DMT family transporter [Candidatus Curtissbacteria bacterium]
MIPFVFALLILVGGSNSSVVKFSLLQFPPLVLVVLRALTAFVVLAPFILKTTRITTERKTFNLFLVNTLFAINWLTFAIGLQKTSVTMSQLMYVPTSLIVAFLSAFILKEKFTKTQIIGLSITIFGALIIAFESISGTSNSFGSLLGNAIVFFGVLCWSLYLVLSKKISHIYSPLTIIFYNFLVSFILASALVIANPSARNFDFENITHVGFLSLAYIGIMSSSVYFYLNQWFIKHTSAFFSSLQIYPLTVIASILGAIFFHETITLSLIISASLIMSGVYLATSFQYVKRNKHG